MPKNYKNLLNTTTLIMTLVMSTLVRLFFDPTSFNDNGAYIGFSVVLIGYLLYMIFKSRHMLVEKKKGLWFLIALIASIVVSVAVYFVSRNDVVPTIHLFISFMIMLGLNTLILKRVE